jgi:hypothetical protein
MWKILLGFAVFAALAIYVSGEKHGVEVTHAPAAAPASTPASAPQ